MIILSLDPGGTSGYAWGKVGDGNLFRFNGSGQSKLSGHGLFGMLESVSPAYIVAESFEYRPGISPRDRLILVSRDLLGVSEMWCELRNRHHCLQSASTGKSFYADAKLQKMGVWVPGNVHANDASRHLLHFITFGQGGQWLGQDRPVIELYRKD